MRIPRIFTQHKLQVSASINLESKAVKHVKDVLRMSTGSAVILFNGDGNDYYASISDVTKKSVSVFIDSKQAVNNESSVSIHLLQPLCRADKMDWCIQKATELGVSQITPFVSSRVNINIAANRLEKKMDHWRSVIESACEQSGRAVIPCINDFSVSACVCVIGPEGGFSQDEILQAQHEGFIPIKMGPRILRLETAVISALTLCQSRWGDLN